MSSSQNNPQLFTSLLQNGNTHKAGVPQTIKEKVDAAVHAASGKSNFYLQQKQHAKVVQQKIDQIRTKAADYINQMIYKKKTAKFLYDGTVQHTNHQVEKWLNRIKDSRDYSQIYGYIDFDMFFAAIEIRDNPELKGKPIAIGGNAMLSTANYEARAYGVRSAMPGFIAKTLCPELIILSGNSEKYRKAANQARDIFQRYDPNFVSLSLDEASLYLTPYIVKYYHHLVFKDNKLDPEALMRLGTMIIAVIRNQVFQVTQITCSAGIAFNRRFAKVCSDINKPNGQFSIGYQLEPGFKQFLQDNISSNVLYSLDDLSYSVMSSPHLEKAAQDFLFKLPVRKISGIGKVTEQILSNVFNVHTIQDYFTPFNPVPDQQDVFFQTKFHAIFVLFPHKTFLMHCLNAFCTLNSWTKRDRQRKSVGHERTLSTAQSGGLNTIELLQGALRSLCDKTLASLSKVSSLGIPTLACLKIRDVYFNTCTKNKQLPENQNIDSKLLFDLLWPLLQEEMPIQLRLLGVRVSKFVSRPEKFLLNPSISAEGQMILDSLKENVTQNPLKDISPPHHHQDTHINTNTINNQKKLQSQPKKHVLKKIRPSSARAKTELNKRYSRSPPPKRKFNPNPASAIILPDFSTGKSHIVSKPPLSNRIDTLVKESSALPHQQQHCPICQIAFPFNCTQLERSLHVESHL